MTPHHDEGATLRLPWLSMAATIVVAAALLVVFRPALRNRLRASGALRAPDVELPLRVTPLGDSLRITWPAQDGAVGNARAAALSIRDGDQWRRIELDGHALAAGQFLYRPSSAEVLVRLDVTGGADHPGAIATVRVLGLPPHQQSPAAPVLEVAANTAPPPDEQTADRALATSPEIAGRKAPAPLPKALATVHGVIRVDVRVAVAADGTVQSADFLTPAQSPYFNRLSLAAAQGSRFPPSADGSSLVLRYEYSRAGVKVSQPAK